MSSLPNNFNPSDYQFLIKSLMEGNWVSRAQSLKRLNTLVGTDRKQFGIYGKRIVLAIQELMLEPKEDINLLASTLTLELINLNPREIEYYVRSKLLKHVVRNLGDEKPQLRKTSHYCLMAYVKTYKSFDQLFQVYLTVGLNSEEWQLRQKAVNSLQSILIMEMKYLNWGSNEFKRIFETLLLKLKDQNMYVQKAVEQCLLSLCKMDELRAFSKKLLPQHFQILRAFCEKQLETGTLPEIKLDLDEKKPVMPLPIKLFSQARQESTRNLANTSNSMMNLQKMKLAQENSQKRAIIIRIQEIRRNNSNNQTPKVQKQELQTMRKAESLAVVNHLKEIKKKAIERQRTSEIKLEPIKKQAARQLPLIQRERQESLSKAQKQETLSRKIVDDLRNEKDWKVRLEAIEELQLKFQSNKETFDMDTLNKVYMPILVKLLGDGNFKVALISLKIIEQLLTMPSMSLDTIVPQLAQRLSDNKIALRQNISKLIRSEYLRTRQPIWIESLLSQLKKQTNSNTKEEILSILSRLYEQKDQPRFPIYKVIDAVCPLMDDLKTKIKIKTLDVLVLLTLRSNERQELKNMLMGKLNQVYFEMYSQKLMKQTKNKDKETLGNVSTEESAPASSVRTNRAATLQNKRYSKVPGNVTTSSLQREKNTRLDPNDTVRTSSFMEKGSKRESGLRVSEQLENSNSNSKVTLNDSISKNSQRKRSFLKSFRKKPTRSSNYQSTNYSAAEDYEPFNEPEKEMRNILAEIKSDDWEISFEALNKLKRIIAHHSELLSSSAIKSIVPEIMRLVENLRSSLSKNAVTTLNELALKVKRGLDSELDVIFNKLIKKSLDTNSFISEEVKKVLVTVCSTCNQTKVLSLLTASHTTRAIPIKQVIAHILQNITFLPKIYEKQLEKVVMILNDFMSEGSLEIRQKTRAILTEILDSQRGKQVMRLISAQHLAKLKKQSEQKIPELKVVHKEQVVSPQKRQAQNQGSETLGQRRKKKQKISVFPEQFDGVEGLLQKCESSDWKVRWQSMSEISQIYMRCPEQAGQHRLNSKFIDVLSKQIGDPNVKVATNALKIFKQLVESIPGLIENNLSVVTNEVFNCFASQKVEVRTLAEEFFDQLCVGIEGWMLVQHLCNGVLYGVQKSKPTIMEKLNNILPGVIRAKPNIFQKNVYSMLNKVAEEGKPELTQPLKKLVVTIQDQVGEGCFEHLKPKVRHLVKS